MTEWLPPFIPPFDVPGIVVPPPFTPTPPCDPKTDKECPPPPPPDGVPEPATWVVLIVGVLATVWYYRRRRAPIE